MDESNLNKSNCRRVQTCGIKYYTVSTSPDVRLKAPVVGQAMGTGDEDIHPAIMAIKSQKIEFEDFVDIGDR